MCSFRFLIVHLDFFCSSGSSTRSRRARRGTTFFGYGAEHTLYSATTRKCEQIEKKRNQNNQYQKTHHERRRNRVVEELEAALKKKEKKSQKLFSAESNVFSTAGALVVITV